MTAQDITRQDLTEAPCENFLYGFKAARWAARAGRHGALAFAPADAPADAPATAAPTPVGWRERRKTFGPPLTDSSYPKLAGGVSMLPLRNCPRPVRTRQGPL